MFKKLFVWVRKWSEPSGNHHDLCKFSLFKELNDHELQLVHNSLQYRTFKAGEVIFEAGFPIEVLYFITSGEVQLSGLPDEGSIMVLKKNQCLGVLDLFANQKRLGSAKAVTDLELMTLPHTDFWEMVQKNSSMGVKLLTANCRMLGKYVSELRQDV